MAATALSAAVSDGLRGQELMHINTFSGHPAACAAALENLAILESEQLVENSAQLESTLQRALEEVEAAYEPAFRTNTAGLLACIEFTVDAGWV